MCAFFRFLLAVHDQNFLNLLVILVLILVCGHGIQEHEEIEEKSRKYTLWIRLGWLRYSQIIV